MVDEDTNNYLKDKLCATRVKNNRPSLKRF